MFEVNVEVVLERLVADEAHAANGAFELDALEQLRLREEVGSKALAVGTY